VNRFTKAMVFLPLAFLCLASTAETYKCTKSGQTVYSDIPCASGASRVDASADNVSKEQRKQAETVHLDNRKQLSEIEYQTAQDRVAQERAAQERAIQDRYSSRRSAPNSR